MCPSTYHAPVDARYWVSKEYHRLVLVAVLLATNQVYRSVLDQHCWLHRRPTTIHRQRSRRNTIDWCRLQFCSLLSRYLVACRLHRRSTTIHRQGPRPRWRDQCFEMGLDGTCKLIADGQLLVAMHVHRSLSITPALDHNYQRGLSSFLAYQTPEDGS